MATYILLALGMISMTIFLLFRDKEGGLFPTTLKAITSLFFVATAIVAIVDNSNICGFLSSAKLLVMGLFVLGLVCGLIGDIALDLKITYLKTNERHSDLFTYVGMGAFGIGHIFYIVSTALYYSFNVGAVFIIIACALGATAFIFILSIFVLKMRFGKFIVPSIVYAFLLTMFLGCAITAGISAGFNVSVTLLVIGSAAFLLSDLVLSGTYFEGRDGRFVIIANHVLYYGAQFLIAMSLYYLGV